MDNHLQLVVFTLDDQRYALHLSVVERIVRAVEVTPLPRAPEIIVGVINIQGTVVPVVNMRRRFRIPERELLLVDHLVIARTLRRVVALIADAVTGLVEVSADKVVPPEDVVPGTAYLDGIVKLEEGIILIHDLDKFLSLDEERALNSLMAHHGE
jgi:purine-binding chemotaxis protein CheW